jgi:hypothetical protein
MYFMIEFMSSDESPTGSRTSMDVCSYAEDWCLFTITDNSAGDTNSDGQGEFLTYGLGGKTGATSIPQLFEFSLRCPASGHYVFPDENFIQEHVSETPMKQWMEVEVKGPGTIFTIGEFPEGKTHDDGYSYSYPMPTGRFLYMVEKMMDLYTATHNA